MRNVLLVNKPSGITSYDVIRILKKAVPHKKIGHAGTLDPLASGLLIVLVDDATKLSREFMELEKVYRVKMRLGVDTASGDMDGAIVGNCPVPRLDEQEIRRVLEKFTGKIEQTPPMYSALKHKGKKLYEYARAGVTVDVKPRTVEVKSIELLGFGGDEIELSVVCSKGTYIRSLVQDIAREMKTCAAVSALVRERIGEFLLTDAASPGDIKADDIAR